jgi:anti-sigma-K factor RskA
MTTPDNSEGDRARDEVLAGEYVLGVLSLRDRIAVENRMERDRAFAAIVARWQGNLSEFDHDYVPVAPPAAVFSNIEQRLFAPQGNKHSRGIGGLWNSLVLWRGATVASLALLLAFALYESAAFGPGDPDAPLVAELAGEDAPVTLLARYDRESGRLQMTPVAAAGPAEERSLELWLVPGGDEPTISLGVLPQTGEGSLVIPADLRQRVTEGATLAVSLEPFGGSPTGQATGPVIAIGQTRRPVQ